MSNLLEYAQNELDLILQSCKDDEEAYKMQNIINKDILDIIKKFSNQGHSGFTAKYAIDKLNRLLDYKPITPLTGDDSEWAELDYGDDIQFQNKRCPSVFKDKEGKAYNVEAKVFSDDNGHTWFTSGDSREYITFPYNVPSVPESVLIDNTKERQEVLNNLKKHIEDLNEQEIEKEINEDDLLSDYLSKDKWLNLQDRYVEDYKITSLLQDIKYVLDEDIHIWEIINFIINSDKESDKEEE